MNRCQRALLAPLLAVLAVVLGFGEKASAAFNPAAQNPHYGEFLLWEAEAWAFESLQPADPTRGNGEWVYDSALGVPVYVRQNPWTFFDPLGLKEQEIGEVYVEVNHKTKEFYVGQTARTAEERMNDSKHSASKLRDKEGTLGYSRTVVADDGDNPGGLSARDQARARMAVERELHGDAKAKWGEQGYKSLNDEKQLLSDEKYDAEKRTTKPTLKAKEKPKVYESQKKTLGWGRKMKAVGSRAGITRGLALGGAGAILGVAAMYSDGDDTSLRMTAWASSPWANESLEHDLAQDIGGNLGTPGFLAVGKALQEARERAR